MTMKTREPAKKGCRKCGSKTIAWEQGSRGKWYLVEIFRPDRDEHGWVGDRTDFHSLYCGNKAKHDERQREIWGERERDEAKRQVRHYQSEQERIDAEVEMLLAFSRLDSTERRDDLQRRRDEIDGLLAMNENEAAAAAQAELDLIEDFISELED